MLIIDLFPDFSGELATVRQTHVSYIEQCSEICQRLQDNVQETMVLEVKRENAKAAEAMQTAKVHYHTFS